MLLSLSISFPILRGLIVYIEFNRYNMIIKEPNIYVITAGANLSYINSLPPSVNNISTSNITADKPYTMHTTKVPLYKSIFSCSNNFSSLSFGLKTLSSDICILLFYNIILYNIYWNRIYRIHLSISSFPMFLFLSAMVKMTYRGEQALC